jgi:hypothetical protein
MGVFFHYQVLAGAKSGQQIAHKIFNGFFEPAHQSKCLQLIYAFSNVRTLTTQERESASWGIPPLLLKQAETCQSEAVCPVFFLLPPKPDRSNLKMNSLI